MNNTIGIVGPCASGKSTLIAALRARGYRVHHIAQEHSFVPQMWQKLVNPDVLIFLDVSYPVSITRRALNWQPADWEEQQRRLAHARTHANLYLQTDTLTPAEVLTAVVSFLNSHQIFPESLQTGV